MTQLAASKSLRDWHPIEDLPNDPTLVEAKELRALEQVWKEQRDKLEQGNRLGEFIEKLCREFAIETGILEKLYTLDRGITILLIERGIDAALIPHESTDKDPALVAALIQDQHEAAKSIFDYVQSAREFSTSYIKELHALLTRNQSTTTALDERGRQIQIPLLQGAYKKRPNNPRRPDGSVKDYCPPEHVDSEMDRLVELHRKHESDSWPAEVAAAWLHHRFTEIHPFQDGNGRVARCLASISFIKSGWFPLVVDREHREKYIAALEMADQGDITPLVELFARVERSAFVRALSVARQVEREQRVSQVISVAREDLLKKRKELRAGWEDLQALGRELLDHAAKRMQETEGELRQSLGEFTELYKFEFFVDKERSGEERAHWFHRQIIAAANQLRYFANISDYHIWVRLVMKSKPARSDSADSEAWEQAEMLFSLHGLGREYTGLLGGSVSFFKRHRDEEGTSDARTLVDEVFQINYADNFTEARRRFEPWFEDALVRGVDRWRKGL